MQALEIRIIKMGTFESPSDLTGHRGATEGLSIPRVCLFYWYILFSLTDH
jgi:hypothetical protein